MHVNLRIIITILLPGGKNYFQIRQVAKKLKIDAGQYFYGQDGWVFYDSIKANNGNTLVDYYAEVYFDDEELEKMAQGINMAYDFYAKRGIKYVILLRRTRKIFIPNLCPKECGVFGSQTFRVWIRPSNI